MSAQSSQESQAVQSAAERFGQGSRVRVAAPVFQEFLTFRLGQEEYGLPILSVQEIRTFEAPTRIANAPAFVKGVINLRGDIVPILDLRLRFGCPSAELGPLTVTVILNVANRLVGVVVDSVSEVVKLPADAIQPAPQFNTAVDTSCLVGLGTLSSQQMLILLDVDALLRSVGVALPV